MYRLWIIYKKQKKSTKIQRKKRSEVDKICFQHDIAYGTYKYLPRRTVSDKVLQEKTFVILVILITTAWTLASIVLKLFDKKDEYISTHTGTGN